MREKFIIYQMNAYPQPTPPNPNLSQSPILPFVASVTNPLTVTGPKKILVVDDSLVIRKTLAMKVKGSGYLVIEAADGAGAVSTVRRERPDLILLDIVFPPDVANGGGVSWDGFLIMEWVRRMDEAKNTPIIMMSGGDPERLKAR